MEKVRIPAYATALAAGTILLSSVGARADFPDRPIRFIVAYNPGGGTDTGVRTWVPYLEKCLGTGASVIVENKPGAGGAIGWAELASSTPDGYTLGALSAPNFITLTLTQQVPWTVDSYTYLGNLVGVSSAVAVRPDSPIRTLADFVAAAKASEKPTNIGVSGIGGDDQLTNYRFAQMTGIKFNFVPLDGDANTRNALLGGHIDVIGASDATLAPFIDQLHPLGVASNERSKLTPDVPTFKEQGFDLVGGSTHVIAAPVGIREEAAKKLGDCIAQIDENPDFQADAKKRSVALYPMNAEETAAYVKEETATFQELWKTNPWITP